MTKFSKQFVNCHDKNNLSIFIFKETFAKKMLLTFLYWFNRRTKDIFLFTQEKYTIKTWLYLLFATLSRELSINVNHGKSRCVLWKNYRKCSKITNLIFLSENQKTKNIRLFKNAFWRDVCFWFLHFGSKKWDL